MVLISFYSEALDPVCDSVLAVAEFRVFSLGFLKYRFKPDLKVSLLVYSLFLFTTTLNKSYTGLCIHRLRPGKPRSFVSVCTTLTIGEYDIWISGFVHS